MINKDTKLCVLIASKPGNSGARVHNFLYSEMGLNYIYLPIKVDTSKLEDAIKGIRALGIKGGGISMPYKVEVMKYLDKIDTKAEIIGSVNNFVNREGVLVGYNTDYLAAKETISKTIDVKGKNVVMCGAGGVARAIGLAVKELGGNLTIINRTDVKAKELANVLDVAYKKWSELNSIRGYLFVNATSVGHSHYLECVISKVVLEGFEVVMDAVVAPIDRKWIIDTKLIKLSKELDKIVVTGNIMSLYQAIKQFELCTGESVSGDLIEKVFKL